MSEKNCHTPCLRNMYKTIKKECDLDTLRCAIKDNGLKELISTANPITVFGPTDKAFDKFLCNCNEVDAAALAYHVVGQNLPASSLVNDTKYDTLSEGNQIRVNVYQEPTFRNVVSINGDRVVEADINASNGVLHKIKRVLVPPTDTVWSLVESNPSFTILKAAIQTAGLVEALNDPASALTVFAPTDEAFVSLLQETGLTAEELLGSPALANILLYHVLGLTVFSTALKKGLLQGVETLYAGNKIDILKKCGSKIRVYDAVNRKSKVVTKNVLVKNGVIHVVSKVLLPFSLN